MQKLLLTIWVFLSCILINCSAHKHLTGALRGRLEINGPCAHYVVKVLSDHISDDRVEKSWTDPTNGKVYTNVFSVQNYCSFPGNLKEGDEFYFQFEDKPAAINCMRCMIFVATPDKQNTIKIVQP